MNPSSDSLGIRLSVILCTRNSQDRILETLESLRQKKLEHWFANSESNRSWLALNMTTEAAAGFRAFHFGERGQREIDFVRLRRRLAEGARFDEKLIEEVLPPSAQRRADSRNDGSAGRPERDGGRPGEPLPDRKGVTS